MPSGLLRYMPTVWKGFSGGTPTFPFASDIQLNFNALESDGYTLYEDISGGVDDAEVQGGKVIQFDGGSSTQLNYGTGAPFNIAANEDFCMGGYFTLDTINIFQGLIGSGISDAQIPRHTVYISGSNNGLVAIITFDNNVNYGVSTDAEQPPLEPNKLYYFFMHADRDGNLTLSSEGYTASKDISSSAGQTLTLTKPFKIGSRSTSTGANTNIMMGNIPFCFFKKGTIAADKLAEGQSGNFDYFTQDGVSDFVLYGENEGIDSVSGLQGTISGGVTFPLKTTERTQGVIDGLKNGYFQYATGEQVVNPQFALPVGATSIPAANIHNLIKSYININPTASADPKYDVWDRRNQTSLSTDSIYYDSNNPWSYYVGKDYNELDISVLDSYMNQADKEKAYAKVTTDYCDYDQIAQIFSYATQKTNSVALNIHKYIGNECQLVTNDGQQEYNNGLPVWVDL